MNKKMHNKINISAPGKTKKKGTVIKEFVNIPNVKNTVIPTRGLCVILC